MSATSPRTVDVLAVVCLVVFAVALPLSAHYVAGWKAPGLLFAVPLVLVGLSSSSNIITARTAVKEDQKSKAFLEAILKAVPEVLFELDREGHFYSVTTSHPEQLNVAPEAHIGRTVRDILEADAAAVLMQSLAQAAKTGSHSGAIYSQTVAGELRWRELSTSAIGDPRRENAHFIVLAHDITERKKMELQVAHAQRMETVGRFAGCIAHDFNNILLVMLGFADLIRENADNEKEVLKDIGVIKDSAERAASLTQQLLAFSRKQMIRPVAQDLNSFLRSSEDFLKRLVGENIHLAVSTATGALWVLADPGQLLQVVMNLAANARDAMPDGGKLSIEVRTFEMGREARDGPPELTPGRYAVMMVHDNGHGIGKDFLPHIFEPYFTTKELGRGTGLGLSIVYSIVRQLGGSVAVNSQQGAETSFSVFLPLLGEAGEEKPI